MKENLTILPTGGNGATLVFGAGRGIQTMQVFQTPSNINGNQHYLFHTFYLSKVRSASGGVSSLHLPALPRELSGQGQSSFNVYPLHVHRCCGVWRKKVIIRKFDPRILSPVFTSATLLFLSGIPLLEEKVEITLNIWGTCLAIEQPQDLQF